MSKYDEIRDKILKIAFRMMFPRLTKIGIGILVASIAINLLSKKVGYFSFATSSSVPGRYFYVNLLDKNFKKGDYIVFSFKGSQYFEKGSKMVKIVACLPNDYLEVRNRDFYCNGIYIGTAKAEDKNGNKVEPFIFKGYIPEKNYFVIGTHKDSYDSRYWGFVEEKDIIGKAYKIF